MSKPAAGTPLDTGSSLYGSLVAAWAMLEGSGTTSADSTANGHTLSNVGSNGTSWGTSGSDPVVNFAGGSTGCLAVASAPTLPNTGPWWAAWGGVQTAPNTSTNGMLVGDDTTTSNYVWWEGNVGLVFRDPAVSNVTFSAVKDFTAYHDWLLVFDQSANKYHLYEDGVEVGTGVLANGSGGSYNKLVANTVGNAYNASTYALKGQLNYMYLGAGAAPNATHAAALHANPYFIFNTGSALSPGTLSVTGHTSSSVSLSVATNTGGTSPYSNQLQRAPDVSGSPGSWSNVGSPVAGATQTWTDTGLSAATTYWYRVVVTDSAGSPATANSNQVSQATSSGAATTATLSGPSGGTVNTASTNFSVALDGTYTGTVTPATGGAGTFSPTSLTWSGTNTTKTFTYTPTTTVGSPHAVSISASPALSYSGSPVSYAVTAGTLTIGSPVPNQFWWRGTSGSKTFTVSGTYTGGSGAIQWSTDNATWSTLVATPAGGTFSGSVTLSTGQYTLYLRFAGATSVTASVAPISVAYVVAVGGQSNGSGRATNNQVVYDGSGLGIVHPMLTGITGSGPYTPSSFAALADPYGASADGGSAGSWVPAFVGELSGMLKAPVAIVPTAVGGTSIATDWAPTGATYLQCVHRVSAVGGCDFMAFWLGETDSIAGMSQATFHPNLAAFVAAFYAAVSAPVLMCQLQTFTSATGPNQAAVNAAIAQGAGTTDGAATGDIAHLYAGPVLTSIPTTSSGPNDTSDANHLKSDAKVNQAGGRWAGSGYKLLKPAGAAAGGYSRGRLVNAG